MNDINILTRLNKYDKNHCWQYDIRLKNRKNDLIDCSLTEEYVSTLKTSDFTFKFIDDKKERLNLTNFIKKHEWLGNLSQFTTHWFGAYHKGILAGVILMNMPNAFSKVLGEDTKEIERLVSRGACISWSPKNLASTFLMWTIKYMVKNTQYRLFSAYSDSTAKELGTIYQACNWKYLGQSAGTTKRYINPYNGKLVSDRVFRARSFYKKYAKELNIDWNPNWNSDQSMKWDEMPNDVESQLRDFSKKKQKESKYVIFPSKHKYVYVLGRTKAETKKLNKTLINLNKIYPYPKDRNSWKSDINPSEHIKKSKLEDYFTFDL